MGTKKIGKGIKKKGKYYYVDFRDSSGQRVRKKAGQSRSYAEAVVHKNEVERIQEKLLGIRKPKKILFSKFVIEYLDYSKVNKKPAMYMRDLTSTRHLQKHLENMCLTDINASVIEEYKAKRREEAPMGGFKARSTKKSKVPAKAVSNATINRELACLRAILNKAVEWNRLNSNPVKKMPMLTEPAGRVRYLTLTEIAVLLSNCAGHIVPIVYAGLYTGMRKGEILGLKWTDIDLRADIIHVERSRSMNTRVENSPKAGDRRDIPLSPKLKKVLMTIKRNGEYVFPQGDFTKAFKGAVRRSGIKNFCFHDLRHTFASHLVMSGANIMVVKELLGHKTLDMTLRYAHLAPDARKHAILTLDKELSSSDGSNEGSEEGSETEK